MPRQSRGSAPARRPAPAPQRPQVTPPHPQQPRSASTMASPPAQAAHPPAPTQSQGPGLFGQMASTAAGVAVGSSIGHAIGGFFGGGSSAAPAESEQINVSPTANEQASYQNSGVCVNEIGNFRKCMNENGSDLNICGWYLDQLKACQQAASRY